MIFISNSAFTNWGANFREKDISVKPSDYYKIESVEKKIESVTGANLKGRNLNKADMYEAFLAKADLRNAFIKNANLASIKLQRANLEGANFSDSEFLHYSGKGGRLMAWDEDTILSGDGANLENADLTGANLQKAKLLNTNLTGANLTSANLQEADLREANLSMAQFQQANLIKANLERAFNIDPMPLCTAQSLYQAKLDSEIEDALKKFCPKKLERPKSFPTWLPVYKNTGPPPWIDRSYLPK